ncbi:MAG: hypothetical protein ACRCYZ_05370 [Alphaproteobacteria bacterium]
MQLFGDAQLKRETLQSILPRALRKLAEISARLDVQRLRQCLRKHLRGDRTDSPSGDAFFRGKQGASCGANSCMQGFVLSMAQSFCAVGLANFRRSEAPHRVRINAEGCSV